MVLIGLQVQLTNSEWFSVAPRCGSVVVNLGKMLAESTGWRVKATPHRVLDLGVDRYSVPFFFEPGYHATFPKILPVATRNSNEDISLHIDKDVEYITYGPWIRMHLKKLYAEYKDL